MKPKVHELHKIDIMNVSKPICILAAVCYIIMGSGCTSPGHVGPGRVELYDPSAASLIDSNAVIEIIGRNYKWSEGPVWVAGKQMLLFSDVIQNTVYQWKGKDTPVAYLTPSGYTDTARRDGENGSNGLALDKEGHLLLCQSGNRQV